MNLEILSDIELINRVRENQCSDSVSELLKRHEPLFHKMVWNFSSKLNQNSTNDILDEKISILYKSIMDYDAEKGLKFSSFFGNYAKYRCLSEITASAKNQLASLENENSLDFFAKSDHYSLDSTGIEERLSSDNRFCRILEKLEENENDLTSRIIKKRYFSGEKIVPLRELSKEFQMSPQAVSVRVKNFVKEMKKSLTGVEK